MPTKEPMWVAHSLPGRIRFRFAPTKEDVPDLDVILQVPGVAQVRFNKITKSLLIIYDVGALSEEELSSQLRNTLPTSCLALRAPGSEERSADDSVLSQWLYDFAAEANNGTKRDE